MSDLAALIDAQSELTGIAGHKARINRIRTLLADIEANIHDPTLVKERAEDAYKALSETRELAAALAGEME